MVAAREGDCEEWQSDEPDISAQIAHTKTSVDDAIVNASTIERQLCSTGSLLRCPNGCLNAVIVAISAAAVAVEVVEATKL